MAGTPFNHRIHTEHSHFSHPQYNHNRDKYKVLRRDHSKQSIKPIRDWNAGHLPHQFHLSVHTVSYKDVFLLYKPNHNLQWLKINDDYVLINVKNKKIVRIIA
ncbi:hypothetical protein B9T31_01675 [Acinetobacter sp. ANC 4558]|uniref:RcnB family protein n=1 Tax=Acinetobacter sp. ANC 4558 TaxID=1977876 RepID=UPI000A33EC71|nr:RcnB family protein [Acinetobacter sp. ANC 4558]OTG88257.1 hypothetical protein B9T31_01675 [Acinetobacter sp. ANC 4558]